MPAVNDRHARVSPHDAAIGEEVGWLKAASELDGHATIKSNAT
jgi:hypothetical protein